SFDQTDLDISDITYFAIVVGFESLTSTNDIIVKSCSLVPGDIPTIPAPQTANEVLQDCQYYYEKSYESNVDAGTVTNEGQISLPAGSGYDGTNFDVFPQYFSIIFSAPKVI